MIKLLTESELLLSSLRLSSLPLSSLRLLSLILVSLDSVHPVNPDNPVYPVKFNLDAAPHSKYYPHVLFC